jgi:NADH dehydrogenase [ubiquinone] 1 alpha subcomplex assembly factor 7
MKRDVFNEKGDFITSVEMSQMFCEMVGIWAVYYLGKRGFRSRAGDRDRIAFLELGPGRGTLCRHIMSVLTQLGYFHDVEFNLVEVSPFLKSLQQEQIMDALQAQKVYLRI